MGQFLNRIFPPKQPDYSYPPMRTFSIYSSPTKREKDILKWQSYLVKFNGRYSADEYQNWPIDQLLEFAELNSMRGHNQGLTFDICEFVLKNNFDTSGRTEYILGKYHEFNHTQEKIVFKNFQISAEKGYPQAYYPLGQFYIDGILTQKNKEKAYEIWKIGVNKEDPNCCYEMALYFEEKKMIWTAFELLGISAKKGFESAKAALKRMNLAQIKVILMLRLLDENNNPRHPGNLFLELPKDVVYYLFQFL